MNDRNRRARIKRVAEKVAQRANEAARKNPKPQCDAPIKEDVTLLWHSANNVAAIHLGHSRPSWIDETFRQLTECIRGGCSNLEYTRAEYAERIPLVPDADFIGRAVVLCDLDYRPLIDLIERIGTERAWAVLIDKAEPELVPVTSVQAAVDQVRAAVMRQEADSKQGIIEKHNALVPDAVAGRKSRTGGSKGGKKKHANKTKRLSKRNAAIIKYANSCRQNYSLKEFLDLAKQRWPDPDIKRRQLREIVSSVYPKNKRRVQS